MLYKSIKNAKKLTSIAAALLTKLPIFEGMQICSALLLGKYAQFFARGVVQSNKMDGLWCDYHHKTLQLKNITSTVFWPIFQNWPTELIFNFFIQKGIRGL